LSARVRIHWSLGFPYYGPEFAPKVVLLSLFPAVIICTALGTYWIATRHLSSEEFVETRSYYVLAVLGLLTTLLGIQGFIIVANL
jgi:hypothetical protein